METLSRLGPVSQYVCSRLANLLDERRVVVWYDPERAFADFVHDLQLPHCGIINATGSALRARRAAEVIYRHLDEVEADQDRRTNLLIYLPRARGATAEDQQQDPFEGFARCGTAFGASEAEQLLSLAQLALPVQKDEIARLFRDGRPDLAMLDSLTAGERYPLIRQAFGTDAPVEVLARALGAADATERLNSVPGAIGELARLAQSEFGFAAENEESWLGLRARLGQYILVSELSADLPSELPSAFTTVPRAEGTQQQRALEVCERLRDSEANREVYVQLANAIERDLHLASLLGPVSQLGTRDTFACQERRRLQLVVQASVRGELASAGNLVTAGTRSIWRRDPERTLLWQVVHRCLSFLECCQRAEAQMLPKGVQPLINAYTATDGLWQIDQAQRLFEQAGALRAEDDEIEPLLEACRSRYRAAVAPAQVAFQFAVQTEGWPPEGIRRQTQTFDTHVAPELAGRRKTAYFMVDSLRYEMGRGLGEALQELGAVSVEGVTSVLPTATPSGMAALLPGADGAFTMVEHRGALVPAIGGESVPDRSERSALLARRYGDRVVDLTLEDLLSTAPRRLGSRIGQADLVIVRTQDIDEIGEGQNIFRARRIMSEVIGELRSAATRLATLGIETLVFAADHGHVLVPEILAGDVVNIPSGEWVSKKRRSLLGQAQGTVPGVFILRARDVGILGPVEDFAAASGFKTFQMGTGYFHEGLSLQECIVPVVVVRARRPAQASGGVQVTISYRSNRFTSSVVGLKLQLTSMFESSLVIRLEAFDGSGPKARPIGQAGDCDARDPATGEVVLQAGVETPVPLVVDPDFHGPRIDIRAIDPRSGVLLTRLSLNNARLD